MSIELTVDQTAAIPENAEDVVVIDPRTRRTYRLIREDVYRNLQSLAYDDSPWSDGEQALLASAAFAELDDTDYSHYLQDHP